MPTTYQDITTQVGDQWVAALKRGEDALGSVSKTVNGFVDRLPVPERITKAGETIADRLPQPSEIVAANFALAQRLLDAQKDFALTVLDASPLPYEKPASKPAASKPAAAKATPRARTTKS